MLRMPRLSKLAGDSTMARKSADFAPLSGFLASGSVFAVYRGRQPDCRLCSGPE
jgi:hypothetical protein